MESLYIAKTELSPGIKFDLENNFFELNGDSRPENVKKFYDPILDWLKQFCDSIRSSQKETVFHFKYEYLNSASVKYVYDMLVLLQEASKNAPIIVKWYYVEEDELMKENGIDYKNLVPNLNFEVIEVK